MWRIFVQDPYEPHRDRLKMLFTLFLYFQVVDVLTTWTFTALIPVAIEVSPVTAFLMKWSSPETGLLICKLAAVALLLIGIKKSRLKLDEDYGLKRPGDIWLLEMVVGFSFAVVAFNLCWSFQFAIDILRFILA